MRVDSLHVQLCAASNRSSRTSVASSMSRPPLPMSGPPSTLGWSKSLTSCNCCYHKSEGSSPPLPPLQWEEIYNISSSTIPTLL